MKGLRIKLASRSFVYAAINFKKRCTDAKGKQKTNLFQQYINTSFAIHKKIVMH